MVSSVPFDYTWPVKRARKQKSKHCHLCLVVNESAGKFDNKVVEKLVETIRKNGAQYTVLRPESAIDLADAAKAACGLRRPGRFLPPQFGKRGPVTGLVACGGDGTFNLVARASAKAELPVGILPMGRFNNICRSLYGNDDASVSIEKIIARGYTKIDSGSVAGQDFYGSIAFGLVPQMIELLKHRGRPRFGIGWARLALQAARDIERRSMVIIVDAFRFELSPAILNISLLSHAAGIQWVGPALNDDGSLEVVFDVDAETKDLASLIRQLSRKKYQYGTTVRMYRGQSVIVQPTKDRVLYLDGELLELPANQVDVSVSPKSLMVFN